MIFKEFVLKNFGKFSNKRIQLKEGINLIYGENESGKSTVHGFIKGMLFGMDRGRGRAAYKDDFSRFEPWENSGYYEGNLEFQVENRSFLLSRAFDKEHKGAKLVSLDDHEVLSVEDGDLEILLEELTEDVYENTISIKQLGIETNQNLANRFSNYATSYYMTGEGDIDLTKALSFLKERRREEGKKIDSNIEEKARKREQIENEMSYIWRERQALKEERDVLELEIKKIEKKQEEVPYVVKKSKWRIHPVEGIMFLIFVLGALILPPRPWNYPLAIVIALICIIYSWNRLKTEKRQENIKEDSEDKERNLQKMRWEYQHLEEDLQDKQVQYMNLQERLENFNELSESHIQQKEKIKGIEIAENTLINLSRRMRQSLEKELNQKTGEILSVITEGKYSKVFLDESLNLSILTEDKIVPLNQLSRGCIEQIYFSLRMAATMIMQREEYPFILDDTFAYFDERRLEKVLEWLAKNKRQVLLFTCQKREEEILKKNGISYHKVEL